MLWGQTDRWRCCADFPAATVDYDADSDSVDEFSSGDEAPMDFLDFDEAIPEDPQREADLEEGIQDTEEGAEDEVEDEEDDEPSVTSSSGQGPIIEVAGMPSW